MAEKRVVELQVGAKKLNPATKARLVKEFAEQGYEVKIGNGSEATKKDVIRPSEPPRFAAGKIMGSLGGEGVGAKLARVMGELNEPSLPSAPPKAGKHGGGTNAVIIGTTGETRERKFARGKKLLVATTNIARGVDPKILKAERRAMERRMMGRWDGKPK